MEKQPASQSQDQFHTADPSRFCPGRIREEEQAYTTRSVPREDGLSGAIDPADGLERMLRKYFVRQWHGLADEAVEDAVCGLVALRILSYPSGYSKETSSPENRGGALHISPLQGYTEGMMELALLWNSEWQNDGKLLLHRHGRCSVSTKILPMYL